jgi:hypothetical protein
MNKKPRESDIKGYMGLLCGLFEGNWKQQNSNVVIGVIQRIGGGTDHKNKNSFQFLQ